MRERGEQYQSVLYAECIYGGRRTVKDFTEPRKVKRFRKELLRLGYISVQKSVYAKLIRNRSSIQQEIRKVQNISPRDGSIVLLRISLSEFKKMEVITGQQFSMSLFADELIEV